MNAFDTAEAQRLVALVNGQLREETGDAEYKVVFTGDARTDSSGRRWYGIRDNVSGFSWSGWVRAVDGGAGFHTTEMLADDE